MKTIETIFDSGNFDTKKILNRSTKKINQTDLDNIENNGATFELLQSLNVPVFKYRTQITIHGLFPELKNNYIGNYKNLFQNKNLSIGVKYNAIDFYKKEKIYKVLNSLYDWSIEKNSIHFRAIKYHRIDNKEQYIELLPTVKKLVENIDKSLFFGSFGVFLAQGLYCNYLCAYIDFGAIPEKNMDMVIKNITGKSFAENQILIDAKELEAKKQREIDSQKRQQQANELSILKQPLINAAKKHLTDSGFTFVEKYPIKNDLTVINFDVDTKYLSDVLEISYTAKNYTIQGREKDFRENRIYISGNDLSNIKSDRRGDKTTKKVVTGWVKLEQEKTEPQKTTIEQPQKTEAKQIVKNIQVVDYSDKAIAIIGDTKPIKDKLKDLGGRFNFRLTCGAGWIFPKTKRENLELLINKLLIA